MGTPTKRADAASTLPRQAGPLTTIFTTPDFCAPGRWSATATPALSSSICMPPEFNRYYDYKYGFYSPGICPMGYTEGCAFPKTLAGRTNGTPFFGGTLMAGETARICCPTGYTCYTGSDEDKTYSQCIATAGPTTFLGYNYRSNTYLTTVTDALAYAIQVRWQSSDLPSLETDPTVPGSKYNGPMPTATDDATGVRQADGGRRVPGRFVARRERGQERLLARRRSEHGPGVAHDAPHGRLRQQHDGAGLGDGERDGRDDDQRTGPELASVDGARDARAGCRATEYLLRGRVARRHAAGGLDKDEPQYRVTCAATVELPERITDSGENEILK
ncbi:hypothetical protein PG997_009562 [Apiospora hydei]|uniref:Uncharacterized protein n=1 Tax=Apiospora hydei TaxID=1337664 RepID=A0ABR1VYA4_9PEZI